MDHEKDTIVVFTARSPDRIIAEGGSQAWKLNPARAKLCKWLVCTQNRHNPDYEFSDATEPHGSAFLLCKVIGVTQADEGEPDDRWKIVIGEYVRIDVPSTWQHWRNPVYYSSLEELGIKSQGLKFRSMPKPEQSLQDDVHTDRKTTKGLTIDEAKRALALTFGVKPEAVEITIRG